MSDLKVLLILWVELGRLVGLVIGSGLRFDWSHFRVGLWLGLGREFLRRKLFVVVCGRLTVHYSVETTSNRFTSQ